MTVRIPWRRVGLLVLLLAVTAVAIGYGLRLRRDVWLGTEGVHFRGDISSGWNWGRIANEQGLTQFYDYLESETAQGRLRRNDYPPLRLLVMTRWQKWTTAHDPAATKWKDDYDFTAPMLHTNTAAELAASVLVFFVIRLLRARMDDASRPPGVPRPMLLGVLPGLFGGLLFWFNPAVIWDGHCWPQWDVWLMPFFVAAVLLACLDWWFTAGLFLIAGAFFKGQMLLGAPVLLLWPLFGGWPGALWRLVCGIALGAAVIATPWMRLSPDAWVWVGRMAGAALLLSPAVLRPQLRWRYLVPLTVAALLLAWPWASAATSAVRPLGWVPWGPAAAVRVPLGLLGWLPLVIVVAHGGLPRRLLAHGCALALAASLLLTIALFGSSNTWYTMGFEYGAAKFERMITGSGSWNVPAMLVAYLGWDRDPNQLVAMTGLTEPVTVHGFTRRLYAATLVLCGIGAAIQARRRDTRLLAALVAPWLLFFMLLTQMHGRYSVWAAGFSALLAGISTGMALLGLVVSVVAMLGIVQNQFLFVRDYAPDTLELLTRLDPHLGWVLMLAAVIYLYTALAPRRRMSRASVGTAATVLPDARAAAAAAAAD